MLCFLLLARFLLACCFLFVLFGVGRGLELGDLAAVVRLQFPEIPLVLLVADAAPAQLHPELGHLQPHESQISDLARIPVVLELGKLPVGIPLFLPEGFPLFMQSGLAALLHLCLLWHVAVEILVVLPPVLLLLLLLQPPLLLHLLLQHPPVVPLLLLLRLFHQLLVF